MKRSAHLYAAWSIVALAIAGRSGAQTSDSSAASHRPRIAWSGAYIGLQFGGHVTETQVGVVMGSAPPANVSLNRNGIFGGIHFGDGRQVRGVYLGGEADSAFGRFVSGHVQAATDGGLTSTFEAHRRFVGTVRGKLGHPFGRVLAYGTGGFAVGGLEQGVTGPTLANNPQGKASSGSIEPGYAVGGGAEYLANQRLSYQIESLYYRLQDRTLNVTVAPGAGTAGSAYNSTLQNSGSVLWLAANYHF